MKITLLAAAVCAAVGLTVSAFVHVTLAGPFDANVGTIASQGVLFRVQAVIDVLAAALIVIRPRRWASLIVAVVALGGLALILVTVAVPLDLTAIGLPYLFEPSWYQNKIVAAVAQGVAALGALVVTLGAEREKSRPAAFLWAKR